MKYHTLAAASAVFYDRNDGHSLNVGAKRGGARAYGTPTPFRRIGRSLGRKCLGFPRGMFARIAIDLFEGCEV